MANIYISYNSKDAKIAQSISSRLKAKGHKVILDVDALIPGQDWRTTLMSALESSDAVVALISKNSLSAHYVMTEVGAARALKKNLIPIVIGNIPFPLAIQDIFSIPIPEITEEKTEEAVNQISGAITHPQNKNVFIVHGHDEAKKWELKNFLSELGVRPVVLHEQDDLGKTIIEKFEYYASQSVFGFVLMTPDEQTSVPSSTEAKWRTRQNVIMELGWFMAKLGRNRIVVLHRGAVEVPSDISGVIYLEFRDSVLEVAEKIRQRLRGVGLIP
jgi:predicted nucleotide-binding protein